MKLGEQVTKTEFLVAEILCEDKLLGTAFIYKTLKSI